MLEVARNQHRTSTAETRIYARILATLGDAYRVLGHPRISRRLLREAEELQIQHGFLGDHADFTSASMAKLESSPRRALEWIHKASQVQQLTSNAVGLTRSLTLEVRLSDDREVAQRNKPAIEEHRRTVPALAQCRRLTMILENWEAWEKQRMIPPHNEKFWNI